MNVFLNVVPFLYQVLIDSTLVESSIAEAPQP
jgi:hypothetical protein